MKRTRRLAAVLVALGGAISATYASAGAYENAENPSAASPAELSRLTAELSDTAARLAALEEQHTAKDLSSAEDSGTTIRWLTDQDEEETLESENTYGEASKISMPAPRPAALAFQEDLTALPAPTNSTIIRIQATDDILSDAPEPTPLGGDSLLSDDGCCDTCCDACDDTCCDVCDDTCCDVCCNSGCDPGCGCAKCKPPRIVVVGTEFVFLSPELNGVPVSYQFDDFGTPETLQFGPAFDDAALDDFYAAPRIWMGVQGPRWGVIARYYHLRAGENAHDLFIPAPFLTGDHGFDANNLLEAYYADIELTRNFCLHGCKNQFAFGCRYALIEHDESIYGFSDTTDGLLMAGARRNRMAHGTGITMALNGRKPLFCNSCANWFYNVRGSILWGPTDNEVQSWSSATASGSADVTAGSIDGAAIEVDDDLFIGEVQVGLEWDFALRCLPAKAFFRTAFEYQYWDASSGSAASGSFAGFGDPGDFQVTASSSAPGLIVDFLGLSIGTGFTW